MQRWSGLIPALLFWAAALALMGRYLMAPAVNTPISTTYLASTMEDPPWFFYFHPVTTCDSFSAATSYNAVDGQVE